MSLRIGSIAYLVRDYDEAIDFFTRVLGFALTEDRPMGEKRFVVVTPDGGGGSLVLARAATPEQVALVGGQSGGRVFLFLETDDFEREHARLTALGIRFLESPRHETYGSVAVFVDLYGNKWDLLQRKSGTSR